MTTRREIIEENFRRMRENYLRSQEILRQKELQRRYILKIKQKSKSKVNFDNLFPAPKNNKNMGMNL